MNLVDRLPTAGAIALVEPGGRHVSFDALRRDADRIARGLRGRLAPGTPVVLMQPIGVDLYRMLAGLLAAELPAVLVDPAAGLLRMRAVIAGVGAGAVMGPALAQGLRCLVPGLRFGVAAPGGWFAADLDRLDGAAFSRSDTCVDTPALISFTTGSTGRPKALARRHGLLDAQRVVLGEHLGVGSDDVDLATLPVFALSSLAAGARVVLADCDLRRPGAADGRRIAAQIEAAGVTTCTASPAFFRQIVDTGVVSPRVRAVFTGGARVSASLLAGMCRAFPNARVEVVYGSSEAEPIAALDARAHLALLDAGEADGRGALVGAAVVGARVRVTHIGAAADVSDGEAGEVLVHGAHVSPSYWKDPVADAVSKLRDADGRVWHRTGDVARRDADGRLWLLGRVGEDVAGVWPFPVEAAAERVDGVRRAALLASGGEPVLVVEGDADDAALRARAGVARVVKVARIPVDRRHNAKVDRPALRQALRGTLEA